MGAQADSTSSDSESESDSSDSSESEGADNARLIELAARASQMLPPSTGGVLSSDSEANEACDASEPSSSSGEADESMRVSEPASSSDEADETAGASSTVAAVGSGTRVEHGFHFPVRTYRGGRGGVRPYRGPSLLRPEGAGGDGSAAEGAGANRAPPMLASTGGVRSDSEGSDSDSESDSESEPSDDESSQTDAGATPATTTGTYNLRKRKSDKSDQ